MRVISPRKGLLSLLSAILMAVHLACLCLVTSSAHHNSVSPQVEMSHHGHVSATAGDAAPSFGEHCDSCPDQDLTRSTGVAEIKLFQTSDAVLPFEAWTPEKQVSKSIWQTYRSLARPPTPSPVILKVRLRN